MRRSRSPLCFHSTRLLWNPSTKSSPSASPFSPRRSRPPRAAPCVARGSASTLSSTPRLRPSTQFQRNGFLLGRRCNNASLARRLFTARRFTPRSRRSTRRFLSRHEWRSASEATSPPPVSRRIEVLQRSRSKRSPLGKTRSKLANPVELSWGFDRFRPGLLVLTGFC